MKNSLMIFTFVYSLIQLSINADLWLDVPYTNIIGLKNI